MTYLDTIVMMLTNCRIPVMCTSVGFRCFSAWLSIDIPPPSTRNVTFNVDRGYVQHHLKMGSSRTARGSCCTDVDIRPACGRQCRVQGIDRSIHDAHRSHTLHILMMIEDTVVCIYIYISFSYDRPSLGSFTSCVRRGSRPRKCWPFCRRDWTTNLKWNCPLQLRSRAKLRWYDCRNSLNRNTNNETLVLHHIYIDITYLSSMCHFVEHTA